RPPSCFPHQPPQPSLAVNLFCLRPSDAAKPPLASCLNSRPRGKAFAPSCELLGLEVDLIVGRADPAGSSNSRTVLSGFREYPPINLLSHGIVSTNLSGMRAQRGHSLIEFAVGQARQEGVGAKGGLSYEFRPVRGHSFPDDRMVLGEKASSDEGR